MDRNELFDKVAETVAETMSVDAEDLTPETTVKLLDALKAVGIPCVEVHISDVYAREAFRHHSYIADVAVVHVIGEGVAGYARATQQLLDILT